jgi:hypothetical protein
LERACACHGIRVPPRASTPSGRHCPRNRQGAAGTSTGSARDTEAGPSRRVALIRAPIGYPPPTGNAAECTQPALHSQDGESGLGRSDSVALRLRGPKRSPDRKPAMVRRDPASIAPRQSGLTLAFCSRRVVIRQNDLSTSESAEPVICWTASHCHGAAERGPREVRWVESPPCADDAPRSTSRDRLPELRACDGEW